MDLKGLTAAKVAPTDDVAEASARPLTSQVLAHLVKLLRHELRHERGTTEHLDDAIGPVAVHDGAGARVGSGLPEVASIRRGQLVATSRVRAGPSLRR